jgi:hypothetical protein
VVNEIADMKDWEQLAISLGLTTNDIDLIKQYDHNEHHQRLAELWYDRPLDYSWGKLRRELDKFYPRQASDAPGKTDINKITRVIKRVSICFMILKVSSWLN